MIIDWFSPLPPARSGISRYALDVLGPLSKLATVRVWSTLALGAELPAGVQFIQYSFAQMPWNLLNADHIAIYNLGNNAEFHSDIFRVSLEHSGIVVLHDTYLQDFFRGFYAQQSYPFGWQDALERWYGPAARVQSESYIAGLSSFDDIGTQFPLTQAALENALGVVVHNASGDKEVNDAGIPVLHIPLPFAHAAEPGLPRHQAGPNASGKTRLIVFGHIGRNRGIAEILEALARLPNRTAFHLDIYGSMFDLKSTRELISSLQISGEVTLHGFVNAEELTAALRRADLAMNLRMPTMGETSQSQLEIWSHALPSVVSQTGWYASLPRDAVAFVRPGHEVEDLVAHLTRFPAEREQFVSMGWRGHEILTSEHQPQKYSSELVGFAGLASRFNAPMASYKMAERLGRKLAGAMDDLDRAYVGSLAQKIRSLWL